MLKNRKKKLNIWDVLNFSLGHIKKLLVKHPLEPLSPEDRKHILYCRDYICTIPSALELFLRCIDWFDPLQVNLARIYLKKWAKIDPEDAIGLLDGRFPDTCVREHAVSILKEVTDDLINTYMLQMVQALLYEPYFINPLSDFLIMKAVQNPTLIGSVLYWNAQVLMNNRICRDRLMIIVCTVLMIGGNNFLKKIELFFNVKIISKNKMNRSLKKIALEAKEEYNNPKNTGDSKTIKAKVVKSITGKLKEMNCEKFYLPIHPSYYAKGFCFNETTIFSSKMVPINIAGRSSESKDGDVDDRKNIFLVIYKCGI